MNRLGLRQAPAAFPSCRANGPLWRKIRSTRGLALSRICRASRSVPGGPRFGGLRIRRSLAFLGLSLFAAAQTALAHGDLHLRILALTRQIEAATNNPAPLYLQRAELHREHADWDAAAADYARATELDPNLPGVELGHAKLLSDSGQLQAALPMFDRAIARWPEDGEAYVGRARLLLKLGRRKEAITDYQRGLDVSIQPAPEYYFECAQQWVAERQVDQALHCLDQGTNKLGPVLKLQSYAVDLELERKNYESALARLDTLIATTARKETWLAKRGQTLLAAGRPVAQARKSFEAALEAINRLPPPLQRGRPMQKLRAEVEAALAGLNREP